MKVFIVYAHPEPTSLNGSLKNYAVEILEREGHEVIVSDLYKMEFKPIADKNDFTELERPEKLNYIFEQLKAVEKGTFTSDIIDEQNKLMWADLVIFQFPIWWTESPAILKGWFDRILAYNFAYGPGYYDSGNLKGKKGMLSITHGGVNLNNYGEYGLKGELHDRLFNIQHEKLYFCGMEIIEPFVFPSRADEKTREQYFTEFKQKLVNIENESVIPFHPLSHYEKGQLKPEFRKIK